MTAAAGAVQALLHPRCLAVVGVSRRGGPSRGLVRNLLDHGFGGELLLVNPAGGEIEGLPCHRSVAELPRVPDVALVVAPAEHVADLVADCGRQGVAVAVVFSAGFADDRSPAGQARAVALARAAEATGIRVLGPNCLGFLNVRGRVAASWSSSVARPGVAAHFPAGDDPLAGAAGSVAIVAQSGGLGFSLFNRGLGRGLRFSHVVSAGNEADLDVLDVVDHLVDDPETGVVLLYVEGLRQPERFQAVAARAEATGTQLVVAKVGRSAVAARAALSHTGHLAGDDRAFDAVFARYGVHRVHDAEELLDLGLVLSTSPRPAGPRAAVVSYSGGNAVWMADACDTLGVELPELSPGVQARLEAMLPSFAATANPVDISGASQVTPAEVLAVVADDPGVDALVLIATYNRTAGVEADRPALERLLREGTKPVLLYSYTEPSPDAHRMLRELGVPTFTSTTRCARALQALVAAGVHQPEPALGPWPHAGRARLLADAWPLAAPTIAEHTTKQLLRAVGLRTTNDHLATTPVEAVAAAATLAGPVALKVQSPQVAHKARLGGLALGVVGAEAVAAAFATVKAAALRAVPDAEIDGVLVAEMVPAGVEILVGVQNTSGLGPMVLVGLGGPLAEVLGHAVLYPAPFGPATARRLLDQLALPHILAASGVARPEPATDALAEVVADVSRLAVELADVLAELDLNPVMLDPRTGAAVVVDALAVPRSHPGAHPDTLVAAGAAGADGHG